MEPNLVRIGKYKSAGAPIICLKKEPPHSQSYNRIAEPFICSGIPHPLYASGQSSWGSLSTRCVFYLMYASRWGKSLTSVVDLSCMQPGTGDQLLRKDMSEAQREQLTALLDDIYEGFTTGIAQSRGKTTQEVCEPKSLRKSSCMCQ